MLFQTTGPEYAMHSLYKAKLGVGIVKFSFVMDLKAANRDHIRTTALERSVIDCWGLKLVLRAQPHPP